MATLETGKWSTMMDAAPSSGHGVNVDWHGTDTGWDVVWQIAPINSTNLSGATQPTWIDITARMIDVIWDDGDPDLESRWPVNAARVRVADISDLVGDPMQLGTDPDDRFGTQSLIRGGVRTPGGTWRGLFSGVIDTVWEDWSADLPLRTFELDCFNVLYLLAGYRANATYGTLGTDIEGAAMGLLTAASFPFTRELIGLTSWWGRTVGGAPAQAPLQLLHRVLDSGGALVHASGTGRLEMRPWEYSTQIAMTVVDGYYYVAPGAGYAFPDFDTTVTAPRMRWANSADRLLYAAEVSSPSAPVGFQTAFNSTSYLSTKYRQRNDRPGWPKRDLLNSAPGGPPVDWPNLNNAALYSSDPTRLDSFTIDTQTADVAAPLNISRVFDFLSLACRPGRYYRVQRRGRGTAGWWDQDMVTQYAEHVLTRDGNQWRWMCTVRPRWFPSA